ncbi:ribosome silencing factor [Puteibacter caeruleilacunae]|nr:ribosome silencing factor [Puteibacter caeruleilacunae]
MTQKAKLNQSEQLIDAIVEGIRRKKGEEIILADLTKIGNTECDYFIICHGNSNTHVDSIAQSVEETTIELADEKVWHTDGYRNSQWILLDYMNIMVHVFQQEYREFYDLESLWADATITNIDSEL